MAPLPGPHAGSHAPAEPERAAASESRAQERQAMRRLWQIYSRSVLPAESKSHFEHFSARPITAEEFESRPQVLLLGQYSTGKTSMVRWLTGSSSPHFDVRPQPSTDKFMAVVHGEHEQLIHGNAAACLPQLPYKGLSEFGGSFLANFSALAMPSEVLKDITLVDTPGVLAGKKQQIGRDYEFARVCEWLAERADLVLLTFDAHKLDISDEFQEVMEVLKPYKEKVRCVLNKADQIDASNLVRVYGALLWNVGKILRTPEVARVFVSSFWDSEYRFEDHKQLFDEDKKAIVEELRGLPRATLLRKTHAVVARVRKVRAHFCIMAHLQSQIPWRFRACGAPPKRVRSWLDANLPRVFAEAQRTRNLSAGDMPDFHGFREALMRLENLARALPTWEAEVVAGLDRVIDVEVPDLLNRVGGVSSGPMLFSDPEPVSGRRRGLLGRLGFSGGRGDGDAETPSSKRRRLDR